MTQTVTLELPESLYRSANQIAEATRQPLEVVLQDSLANVLPPLDDVSPEEATELAAMALMKDARLWREARKTLSTAKQAELDELLYRQSAGQLSADDETRLHALVDAYGRLMVRKAHAWLLLARRGYQVPPQQPPE